MNEDEIPRPPYSHDLLADLHAGVLDDASADKLWPLVRADPEAAAVLARLDAVESRLGTLRDSDPAEPIPPAVAARIDAALATAQRRPARTWLAGAGVAAAAVFAGVFALVLLHSAPGGDDDAGSDAYAAHETDSVFEPAELRSIVGTTSLGPLSDTVRLRDCLEANGFDSNSPLLGSRQTEFRERDAVLLLLGGPHPPQLTAVMVGTDCDANTPATLAVHTIG
jgi:hypothetical protein